MNSEALFSRTAPLKLFFLAAIPGAVSMLASALYQTVDGVFVGHFLGSTAFAAVNLAMPFVIINFSLADLIGVGAAVPISICLGRQEKEEANNIFTCAVLMIVGTGVLIGAALFLSAPLVIRLMGADGEFAELAVQYMQVYALCSPVTTIVFAMDNFLRICGFIRGEHVFEYSDVRAQRAAGISVPLCAGLGRLGSGSRNLYRYDGLRGSGADPLPAEESPAAFCQTAFSRTDDPADHSLRMPDFFE